MFACLCSTAAWSGFDFAFRNTAFSVPPGSRLPAMLCGELGRQTTGRCFTHRRHVPAPVYAAQPRHTSGHNNGTGKATSSLGTGDMQLAPQPNTQSRPLADQLPTSLDLAFQSMEKTSKAIKTTGLRRAPLSGGVKNATQRFDLPTPCVAVRNLVEQAQFAHLCTVMSHMHHRCAAGSHR
jgi:hypothetical protein